MSILLADDDAQLATFLSKSLESEGYLVHTALDEGSVLAELKRQNYQLIILDLNLGQTDGLQLLEKLRTEGLETPVIVLSARNRVADRIQSFSLGADDYVTKPFSFQELAARASALLRRKADPSLNVLRVEDLELDPATRKVHRGRREIKLSPKEFDLLYLLLRRAGETVGRHELLRECWGQDSETDSNLVDVYVNYLRKKIDSPEDQKLIYTIRGSGYRLGRPAPVHAALADSGAESDGIGPASLHSYSAGAYSGSNTIALQQGPLRALIHSITHDLAQPLTSVRCFLEAITLRQGKIAAQPADLRLIEEQADRAIALTKGISALVREGLANDGAWTSLDGLLNEILDDFAVLLHSGFLALERQWDTTIKVTSSPVLRQLIVLFLSKLAGRNTRALLLTISTTVQDGRCQIEFHWKPNDSCPTPLLDGKDLLAKDAANIQQMAHSIGGEVAFAEGKPEISVRLPAGPAGRQDVVQ
ncbi:MAG TPA: response regulator [Candidatus Limnocylindrales bacterium]|nr:response regulator [Candidatus Limnocylindrales bacterium]